MFRFSIFIDDWKTRSHHFLYWIILRSKELHLHEWSKDVMKLYPIICLSIWTFEFLNSVHLFLSLLDFLLTDVLKVKQKWHDCFLDDRYLTISFLLKSMCLDSSTYVWYDCNENVSQVITVMSFIYNRPRYDSEMFWIINWYHYSKMYWKESYHP